MPKNMKDAVELTASLNSSSSSTAARVSLSGTSGEEENDCCNWPICSPCAKNKDSPFLTNRVCNSLRTNITSRMVLGVLIAIILGPLISLGRPVRPDKRTCSFNSGGFGFTADQTVDDCTDYGVLEGSNMPQGVDLDNLKKRIPMCLDNENDVKISWGQTNCNNMFYLNTSLSTDVIYCYGTVNNNTIGVISRSDTKDCKKFKNIMVGGMSIDSPSVIYTAELVTAWNGPAGANGLLFEGAGTIGINPCDVTIASCSNKNFTVKPFKEGSATMTTWKNYEAALEKYNQILHYLFNFTGRLWLRGLKLIILPLIIANIITSVASIKELPGAGKLGCVTFFYYTLTTICAAVEAIILCAMILVPTMKNFGYAGNVAAGAPKRAYSDTGQQITSVINAIVPTNGVVACSTNNYLGVIFFSIIAGIAMTNPGDSTFLKWFKELNQIMMKLIAFLIELCPIGVCCLAIYLFASKDLGDVLPKVALFLTTVFVGLFLHISVVYPTIYFVFTRKNPFTYFYNILDAAMFALVISSSIVTLPISLKCAIEKNKISRDIAKFVLTLGATVNMDGTTIGFPIAIVFIAYGQGIHLAFGEMLQIVILSTVSSMGAAPIPQAGLVLLIVMLDNLSIPMEETFVLVMTVDWLYDRPETMTNIIGDAFAAGVIDHWFDTYKLVNTSEDQQKQNEVIRRVSENLNEEDKEQLNKSHAIASEA